MPKSADSVPKNMLVWAYRAPDAENVLEKLEGPSMLVNALINMLVHLGE